MGARMTPPRESSIDVELTPARGHGIEAMAKMHPGLARESNRTYVFGGLVYWQTARWLVDNELAYFPSGSVMLRFTPAGYELALDLELVG